MKPYVHTRPQPRRQRSSSEGLAAALTWRKQLTAARPGLGAWLASWWLELACVAASLGLVAWLELGQ